MDINEGAARVPDVVEVLHDVADLEEDDERVEKVETRGPAVAAMLTFPPEWSRSDDNTEGSDSGRALEIACTKKSLSVIGTVRLDRNVVVLPEVLR